MGPRCLHATTGGRRGCCATLLRGARACVPCHALALRAFAALGSLHAMTNRSAADPTPTTTCEWGLLPQGKNGSGDKPKNARLGGWE